MAEHGGTSTDSRHESLCARCARGGKTCCQGTQIFLTLGDMERIGAAGEENFSERSAPASADYLPEPDVDPVWSRIFGSGGERRVLTHKNRGDCHFLTASGCRLPLEVRPLICRLYPYDYTGTSIKGVDAHFCPRPESGNPALVLALLGMNRSAAEQWRITLYREIEEEFPSYKTRSSSFREFPSSSDTGAIS